MEGTSLDGTARGWAGVWGLIYLDLCATSDCLGACHSGACVVLLGSAKALSWAVEHSLKDWCCWGREHNGTHHEEKLSFKHASGA